MTQFLRLVAAMLIIGGCVEIFGPLLTGIVLIAGAMIYERFV